ncbi:MAG: cell division protein ZapA [Alphaproteobacteria bacterium]
MALVELTISGRIYKVACENEEREHLLNLSHYVNERAEELTDALGHISEPLLLVMTCLQIADELQETKSKKISNGDEPAVDVAQLENQKQAAIEELVAGIDNDISSKINNLAEKIYSIAQKIEKP